MTVVAPFESCIGCFKGDTATYIGFRGDADWLMAGLEALGVPRDVAERMVLEVAADEYGCRFGDTADDMQVTARACLECGAKANLPVGPAGAAVQMVQPPA